MNPCTCYHSVPGADKIRPWQEQISSEQMENIRKNFPSAKPLNEKPLEVKTEASSAGAPKPAPGEITVLHHVTPFYTGYAGIDNAITDALRGKSQELKDNVYQIIWNDLLPHNVHGLEEEDRLALIGLGVEKAGYLAENFLDDKSKAGFMEAMRSIARIATKGKRVGTCEMDYGVKHAVCIDGNGYVHEGSMEETLFAMERESPKDFETYKKMWKSSKNNGTDAVLFALEWSLKNLSLIAENREALQKRKDEQYEKLQSVKLDSTFAGADTTSKEKFLASIRERLKAASGLQVDFFLERIARMTDAPQSYLYGRTLRLVGRV